MKRLWLILASVGLFCILALVALSCMPPEQQKKHSKGEQTQEQTEQVEQQVQEQERRTFDWEVKEIPSDGFYQIWFFTVKDKRTGREWLVVRTADNVKVVPVGDGVPVR
jgi:hypothetical protein